MKIAIITPGILPVPAVRGGAVEMLIDYLIEYNERFLNHEITVYGIDDKNLSSVNFHVYKKTNFHLFNQQSLKYRLKRKLYSFFNRGYIYNYFLDYFAKLVRQEMSFVEFDIVIIENRPGFILPLFESTNAKFVLHLHNDLLNVNTKEEKKILEYYNAIFTVSNYIKNRVYTIMPSDKVQVVHNGIDLERFKKMSISEINRAKFGLSKDDFVVVYSGRIESIKGVKELLEAFLLLSDYKSIKLLIVGGGNGNVNEGEFFSKMSRLASSMHEKVIFTGFQPYENIPFILNLCDLAVVPSICEDAFPTTVLEGLAAGLPLIVTRSGGIPEAINEECAVVVNRDDNLSSNLAKAILDLYKDRNKRLKMSEYAKKQSVLFCKERYCCDFFDKIKEL